jgi:hypothetical protein
VPENNENRLVSLARAGFAATVSRNLPRETVNQIRERSGGERVLWSRPPLIQTRTSPRRLETIRRFFPGRTRYLEIGLSRGKTLESVRFDCRHAVDPFPRVNQRLLPKGVTIYPLRSDDFFESRTQDSETYDVAFIDGLHTWDQTYRDVLNTFRHSPKAILLVDDVRPSDEISAMRSFDESLAARKRGNQSSTEWCGDVYKAILVIEEAHPNIDFATFATDGYPQTVMWLKDPQQFDDEERGPSEVVASSANFHDVFEIDLPEQFHPKSSENIMRTLRSAIERRI